MNNFPFFLQFEGDARVELVTLPENAGVGDVRAKAVDLGFANLGRALVFAEGRDDPLDDKQSLVAQAIGAKHRLCLHRCPKIHVTIRFVDVEKQHPFAPSATVSDVKAWFVDKIKMAPADATEHVLQLAGTTERPSPDAMIGSLPVDDCSLGFSLVPIKRVEG